MTAPLLQAVPNFSEGRDPGVVAAIVAAIRGAGADVLDCSADPDHNRSVVTMVGSPAVVEDAALAGAHVAVERIDLRRHRGVHPRIGSLDVLPFVPVAGTGMDEARRCAHRTGERLAREVGVPVYYYAEASQPRGRGLRELRRGGFEALVAGWPAGRAADVLPPAWSHTGAHPTAGATCVGARKPLLAWNVFVEGVDLKTAEHIAGRLRERNGGFPGVRALALSLPGAGRLQISMNLEDVDAVSPLAVFTTIETLLAAAGGRIAQTEVIGLVPDRLVTDAAQQRLRLRDDPRGRLLSAQLLAHVWRSARAPQTHPPDGPTS